MADLIGITVPADVGAEIIEFCGRHGYTVSETYFALISGEKLTGLKGLSRKLQSFCLSNIPVKTIIGGPYIENGGALNLAVIPGAGLTALRDKLIKHLKLPPAEVVYRLYIPLIRKQSENAEDFKEILADAKRVFSKPHTISVESISIYTQTDGEQNYRKGKIYALSGR